MIFVETFVRRAICAIVVSCMFILFIVFSVASISCLRRIDCIFNLGIFVILFISGVYLLKRLLIGRLI